MKKTTLTISLFLLFIFQSFGQINPVVNLTWFQEYTNMQNFFELSWQEPASPHGALVGYNVYRGNDFYRFQTETSVRYLQAAVYPNNTDITFLLYNNGLEFDMHVTAVYNPGNVESGYTETAFTLGAALKTTNFNNEIVKLYPNPTHGVLNLDNDKLTKIMVYDFSGKKIKEFDPQPQIDLSDFSKGIYLIKLFSNEKITVDKLIID
jgi:hypothetical protein